MPKKYLGREAILGAPLKTREVEVPEWGGAVRIAEPSVRTSGVIANLPSDRSAEMAQAWWFILHVVDENDSPVFSESDIDTLLEKSFDAVHRVVSQIIDFTEKKADKSEDGSEQPSE